MTEPTTAELVTATLRDAVTHLREGLAHIADAEVEMTELKAEVTALKAELAGMRQAEIERCAAWCERADFPRAEQYGAHVRTLKEVPTWTPPPQAELEGKKI